jgi:hypothetical protein
MRRTDPGGAIAPPFAALGILVRVFVVATVLAGCADNAPVAQKCSADSTVSCTQGSGYSCSGAAEPDPTTLPSMACTRAVAALPDGLDDYCCVAYSSTSCPPAANECLDGTAFGFLCTGTAQPQDSDPSFSFCGTVTPEGSDTLYCCTYQ